LVEKPQSLRYSEITSMPAYQKVTTLNCIEGWSVTYLWRGVKIADLLERAGYDPKAKLVIFRSHDGYSTSLPLDFIVKREILLAYSLWQGHFLPTIQQRVQFWQVTQRHGLRAPEQRGYDNLRR
jgi:DMSO/TMAO reductase YedYZ molybdopterin-dependent catalytic subunit